MDNKNLRPIGMAIIVGVLAIGGYLYLKSQEDPTLADESTIVVSEPAVTQEPVERIPETNESPVATEVPKTEEPVAEITPVEKTPQELYAEEQKKFVEEFKSTIKLQVNLPESMIFQSLDLDSDAEGIHGVQGGSADKKLAVIAARKTGSPQVIAKFLDDSKLGIPMIKENGFKISGDIQKLQAPKETGMGTVTLIPGGEKSGRMLYAAHIERADKKGSYVFLMEASPSLFDSNEDGFENMLKSMKAQP